MASKHESNNGHRKYSRKKENETLHEELVQQVKDNAEREKKKQEKEAERRQKVEQQIRESLINQATMFLMDKQSTTTNNVKKQNSKPENKDSKSKDIEIPLGGDASNFQEEQKIDENHYDSDIWDEGSTKNDASSCGWNDGLCNSAQTSSRSVISSQSWSQDRKSEPYVKKNCNRSDNSNRQPFKQGNKSECTSQGNKKNKSRKNGFSYSKQTKEVSEKPIWDFPGRHFEIGLVEAPPPEVNVWQERVSKAEDMEAMLPHTENDEENMIQQALELSRLQAFEDEKRRKKLEEEYDLQMQYLLSHPELQEFGTSNDSTAEFDDDIHDYETLNNPSDSKRSVSQINSADNFNDDEATHFGGAKPKFKRISDRFGGWGTSSYNSAASKVTRCDQVTSNDNWGSSVSNTEQICKSDCWDDNFLDLPNETKQKTCHSISEERKKNSVANNDLKYSVENFQDNYQDSFVKSTQDEKTKECEEVQEYEEINKDTLTYQNEVVTLQDVSTKDMNNSKGTILSFDAYRLSEIVERSDLNTVDSGIKNWSSELNTKPELVITSIAKGLADNIHDINISDPKDDCDRNECEMAIPCQTLKEPIITSEGNSNNRKIYLINDCNSHATDLTSEEKTPIDFSAVSNQECQKEVDDNAHVSPIHVSYPETNVLEQIQKHPETNQNRNLDCNFTTHPKNTYVENNIETNSLNKEYFDTYMSPSVAENNQNCAKNLLDSNISQPISSAQFSNPQYTTGNIPFCRPMDPSFMLPSGVPFNPAMASPMLMQQMLMLSNPFFVQQLNALQMYYGSLSMQTPIYPNVMSCIPQGNHLVENPQLQRTFTTPAPVNYEDVSITNAFLKPDYLNPPNQMFASESSLLSERQNSAHSLPPGFETSSVLSNTMSEYDVSVDENPLFSFLSFSDEVVIPAPKPRLSEFKPGDKHDKGSRAQMPDKSNSRKLNLLELPNHNIHSSSSGIHVGNSLLIKNLDESAVEKRNVDVDKNRRATSIHLDQRKLPNQSKQAVVNDSFSKDTPLTQKIPSTDFSKSSNPLANGFDVSAKAILQNTSAVNSEFSDGAFSNPGQIKECIGWSDSEDETPVQKSTRRYGTWNDEIDGWGTQTNEGQSMKCSSRYDSKTTQSRQPFSQSYSCQARRNESSYSNSWDNRNSKNSIFNKDKTTSKRQENGNCN